jgi:23S rRNA (cytosine1962-C5)-methyltransferase
MITVHLKEGREKPVRNGHPWIFSGAIERVEGKTEPGEPCVVCSSGGKTIGAGYYNPRSSIRVRMLLTGAETLTESALCRSIDRAIGLRAGLLKAEGTTALRLINAEGDFLPGLVVDKYGDGVCVQILTAGMERFRHTVFSHLEKTLSPLFLFERSDSEAREREGLDRRSGLITGSLPQTVTFKENGLLFTIDLAHGQKTGFFLDQRDNRRLAGDYAKGRAVCDCFTYSGAFTVYALSHGARSVDAVDMSKSSLETAARNLALNDLSMDEGRYFAEDVFSFLRKTESRYDMIILDPPKFAKHPGEVPKAARGYKDINLVAMKKAAPSAIIFTFSCSGAVDPRLFRQIVFSAAADCGRQVQVLHVLSAGPDHPVNIAHPEGDYLKGLVLRVF